MRRLWHLSRLPPLVALIGAIVLGVGAGLGVLSAPAVYAGMFLVLILFGGLTLRADLRAPDDT